MTTDDQPTTTPDPDEDVLAQMQAARETLAAAVGRLAGTGYLVEDDDPDARAALTSVGITTLHDLVAVAVAQTAGDSAPPAFTLIHDAALALYLALGAVITAEDPKVGNAALRRQAVAQLRRAARNAAR